MEHEPDPQLRGVVITGADLAEKDWSWIFTEEAHCESCE